MLNNQQEKLNSNSEIREQNQILIKNDTEEEKLQNIQQNIQKQEIQPQKCFDNIVQKIQLIFALTKMKSDGVAVEIIPNLFLGSIGCALKKAMLQKLGITHVVSAIETFKIPYPDLFQYLHLKMQDDCNMNLQNYLEESNQFIYSALQAGNCKVLVHCFAGKSRSVSLIIGYLIKYHHMNRNYALKIIKEKRPEAQPNIGFMAQLKKYEKLNENHLTYFENDAYRINEEQQKQKII